MHVRVCLHERVSASKWLSGLKNNGWDLILKASFTSNRRRAKWGKREGEEWGGGGERQSGALMEDRRGYFFTG